MNNFETASPAAKPPVRTSLIPYVFFIFCILEICLQAQQRLGPFFDLEWSKTNFEFSSDFINHRHMTSSGYSDDGIELSPDRPFSAPDSARPVKILFLGDSFFEGYPPSTIPQYIWNYFTHEKKITRPLLLWNAGCTSYSPLIYTVHSKMLIPKYKPDLLVVDIDETDIIDDYAFYRHLAVRDENGKVVRVGQSPAVQTKWEIYKRLRKIPLLTVRMVLMWVEKARLYFIFKNYNEAYKAKYLSHPMSRTKDSRFMVDMIASFDEDPNSDSKYNEEFLFFEKSVRELIETLIGQMGDKNKVIFIYHPHIHQMIPDPRGFLWKNRVPPIVQKLCDEYGIRYYNATEDIKTRLTPNEIPDYYRSNDIHFNKKGLRLYAELVAEKMLPKLPQVNT